MSHLRTKIFSAIIHAPLKYNTTKLDDIVMI